MRDSAVKKGEVVGAGEGNRTLVSAIVVSSGLEWPTSLGSSIELRGVSCTTCTQKELTEIWPIYTAKTARLIGIFNTSIRKGQNTTNPPAFEPTIPMTRRKQRR